ncbi:hypothetical protein [Alteriqipengyuania lutimaris]|uniref:hypothetical protein n=1 Tax=Alteriqipengyuania lutimaris TaxID=1538146 RepID=UPI0011C022A9|nr:hypothetical protein [Alteriqipengyuania lutimaris]MBB3035399.1 hypothetical protein [Alteriqipengyuania lutimaris]
MAGRIPMVGDPKPLDREALGQEWATSVARMREDSEKLLAEAEAAGDEKQIKECRKLLAKLAKLN